MRAAAATLAEKHGLNPDLAAALSVYDRDPETRGVMRQEAVADLLEALVDQADPATGEDLEGMSVPDLKELADRRGVELEPRMKKADIIQALEANTRGATDPAGTAKVKVGEVQVPEATEEQPPTSQDKTAPLATHPAGDAPPARSGEVK